MKLEQFLAVLDGGLEIEIDPGEDGPVSQSYKYIGPLSDLPYWKYNVLKNLLVVDDVQIIDERLSIVLK